MTSAHLGFLFVRLGGCGFSFGRDTGAVGASSRTVGSSRTVMGPVSRFNGEELNWNM